MLAKPPDLRIVHGFRPESENVTDKKVVVGKGISRELEWCKFPVLVKNLTLGYHGKANLKGSRMAQVSVS